MSETQVRREFVDPLFEALGWDITNKAGLAEAYKDVIHEDAVKIGGATKAPDYSFRVGGTRKFFLETKKPSVYITLRNQLFHESLWDNGNPCSAGSGDVYLMPLFQRNIIMRLVPAIFNYKTPFINTGWWSLGQYFFDKVK